MHIIFYKSKFCPRSFMARKTLLELLSQDTETSYEEVDVITSPLRAWKDGVRIFPAIKINQNILSGTILTRSQIDNFLKHNILKNIKA